MSVTTPTTTKERIFHAVVFELVALAIIVPISALLTGNKSSDMAMVGIALSLSAVIWNYIYNFYFDKWCGADRTQRGLWMRIGHTIGFECGLIIVTIPALSWFLGITLLQAIILEAGFLAFFMVYSVLFNWVYDKLQPYQRLLRALV
uniref:PACE efflux transporter n=1 Tax=Thaumasiovibrio occultus TaxID=1891184 RepID=UPI000B351F02|nr:PACE efflux transporter [Thaumasiovibrio occultus]